MEQRPKNKNEYYSCNRYSKKVANKVKCMKIKEKFNSFLSIFVFCLFPQFIFIYSLHNDSGLCASKKCKSNPKNGIRYCLHSYDESFFLFKMSYDTQTDPMSHEQTFFVITFVPFLIVLYFCEDKTEIFHYNPFTYSYIAWLKSQWKISQSNFGFFSKFAFFRIQGSHLIFSLLLCPYFVHFLSSRESI